MEFQAKPLEQSNPGGNLLELSKQFSPVEWAAKAMQIQSYRERIQMDRERHAAEAEQHKIEMAGKTVTRMKEITKLQTPAMRRIGVKVLQAELAHIGTSIDEITAQALVEESMAMTLGNSFNNLTGAFPGPEGGKVAADFLGSTGDPEKMMPFLMDYAKKKLDVQANKDKEAGVDRRAKEKNTFDAKENRLKAQDNIDKIVLQGENMETALGIKKKTALEVEEMRLKARINAMDSKAQAERRRTIQSEVKNVKDVDKEYDRFLVAGKNILNFKGGPTDDYSMAKAYNNFFDTLRVSDSEMKMMGNLGSLKSQVRKWVEKQKEGDLLDADTRAAMRKTTTEILKIYVGRYRDKLAPILNRIDSAPSAMNLRRQDVLTPMQMGLMGIETPKAAAPTGPSPKVAAPQQPPMSPKLQEAVKRLEAMLSAEAGKPVSATPAQINNLRKFPTLR